MSGPESQQQHINTIENSVKDGISDQETKLVNDAINFLKNSEKKEDNKTERENKIQEKIDKSKDKIIESIQKIFIMKDGKIDQEKVNILTPEQLTAYQNILNWLNDDTLKTIKDTIDTKIATQKQDKEAKEKQEQDKALFNILSVEATETNANSLFEENNNAWEALFRNTKDGKIVIPDELIDTKIYETPEKMNENFEKLVKIYLDIKDGVKTKIAIITTPENDSDYNEGVKYIKVIYKDENKPATDIMFGKDSDTIHQARYDHLDTKKMKYKNEDRLVKDVIKEMLTEKDLKLQDWLGVLDNEGAHITFQNMVNDGSIDIAPLLDKNIFTEIESYYTDNTKVEKKYNQYYSVIIDSIIQKAKAGDIILFKKYLSVVDAEHTKYLGTDEKIQIANYNKLVEYVKSPTFVQQKDTPIGKEIVGKMLGLQIQLKQAPLSLKESINKGVDSFFQSRGKVIVDVLEFFGGKGSVKKLFNSLGMSDFYDKNFKKIDENINKVYKEKFSLSKEANKVLEDKNTRKDFSGTNFITPKADNTPLSAAEKGKQIERGIDDFKAKIEKKNGGNESNEKINLKKILTENIQEIDPTLVATILAEHNKEYPDNKKNINDFIIKDPATAQRKINTQISDDNKTFIINTLLESKDTWASVKGANAKIIGIQSEKETSRDDLGDATNRQRYLIQSDKDVARYITAYAFGGSKTLDYVITENEITTQADAIPEAVQKPKTKEYTTNEKVNFRDEKGEDPKPLEKGTKITAVLDNNGKEIEKKGSDFGFTGKSLAETKFRKVKYGDKEGFVAISYTTEVQKQPIEQPAK